MFKKHLPKRVLFVRSFITLFIVLLGVVATILGAALLPARTANAAGNSTINFQARLMDASGAIVPDGNYNVEFKLYNASTSSGSSQGSCSGDSHCLWVETYTGANVVRVSDGYLSVSLGSLNAFPSTINWDQQVWLGMNVGGTGTPSWDGEMTPRLLVTAIPYALSSQSLSTYNASNGDNASLVFTAPTHTTDTITLPDDTGTVCLDGKTACGFAASSGSGSYIDNSASVQSNANISIQGSNGNVVASFQQNPSDTTDDILHLIDPGGYLVDSFYNNGSLQIENSSDSQFAFQVQNSVGADLIQADTTDDSVGINGGDTTAGYNLNVNGTINATYGILVGGVPVCVSSGCAPISGSNNYIQNGTSMQPANFDIQSNIGAVTATISADTSGSYDALDIQDSSGLTVVDSFSASGALTIQDSTDEQAFAVNQASGSPILTVDTYSGEVALDGATGGYELGVAGDIGTNGGHIYDEGNQVCTQATSSCSGFYIDNSYSSGQVGNINIQGGSSTAPVATIENYSGGSGNILTLENGSGGTVASIGSTGAALFQDSINSSSAFQVQNSVGENLFLVNSTGVNLLSYGGFPPNTSVSSGSTGWIYTGSGGGSISLNSSLADVYSGNHSLKLTTSATTGQGTDTTAFTQSSAPSSVSVSFSVMLGTASLNASNLKATLATSGTGGNCSPASTTLSSSGFITVSCSITGITGNLSSLTIAQNGGGSSGTMYIDNVQLQSGTTATAYQDDSIQLQGVITNPITIESGSNSQTAFQVQSSTGANLIQADTLDGSVGIEGAATNLGYALNVTGTVAASGTIYSAGSAVCTVSSGCTTTGSFIDNQTGIQTSASFNIQGGASAVTGTLVANGADILDLENSSGSTGKVASFNSTGSVLFETSTNSTTAFQIQQSNATFGSGNPVLVVDNTANKSVAIDGASTSAGDALNVTGTINGTTVTGGTINGTVVEVGGVNVCTATSCAAGYIQNQTGIQTSASFNIQGGASAVTGTLVANGADILDLENSSGSTGKVASFNSTGSVLFETSTNSTTAFQIQQSNATFGSGNPVLVVDNTANKSVAIDGASTSAGDALNVTGTINGTTVTGGTINGTVVEVGGVNVCTVSAGCATHTKKIVLTPEYAGAIITPNGLSSGDVGILTTGLATSGYTSSVPENYYSWTTTQSGTNSYYIIVSIPIPSDINSTVATAAPTLSVDSQSTSSSSVDTLTGKLLDTSGQTPSAWSACNLNGGSSTSWVQNSCSIPTTGTGSNWAANGTATLELEVNVANTTSAINVGNITFSYTTSAY